MSAGEAHEALRAYGRLLGLAADALDDPTLAAEIAALLRSLRAAAERDLGEMPPLASVPPQP